LGGGVNGTNITKNLTVFSNGASTPQWYLLGTFDSTANPSNGASFILEVICGYGFANNPTGGGGSSGGKTTIYGRSLNNSSATYANLELSFKSEGGNNAVYQVVGVQVNAGTSTTARNQYYVYAQMSEYNQGALNVEATTFGSFFTVNPTLGNTVTAPSTTNSSTVIPGTLIYTTKGGYVGIGTTNPVGQLHLYSTLPTSTTSFSRYGQLIVDCARSGAMGGTITVRNSGAGALGSAASIAFELDGSTAYDSGGLDEANARISCVIDGATNNPGAIAFNTWNGSSGGERVRISSGGNVGIGTTNPGYTLDVAGSIRASAGIKITGALPETLQLAASQSYVNSAASTFSISNASYGGASIWGLWCAYAQGRIACGEIWITSDIRIKTAITDIDHSESLYLLRQFQPKTYKFIDHIGCGNKTKYGFIAQDIENSFPDGLDNNTVQFIPNIYGLAIIMNKTTIVLKDKTTDLIGANANGLDSSGNPVRIMGYDDNNKIIETTVTSIIDETTFTVKDPIDSKFLFVYGKEVSDFHNVNYQHITIVAVSALKEIDTIVQSQQQTIQTQQSQIQELKTENIDLKSRLAAIEARLSAAGF